MCHGCQEYLVTREIELPTVGTVSRSMVWVKDRVDSHGRVLTRLYLSEPRFVIAAPMAA